MKDYRGEHGFGRCELCGYSICRVFYTALVGRELIGRVCPYCRGTKSIRIISRFQRRGGSKMFDRTSYNWNF